MTESLLSTVAVVLVSIVLVEIAAQLLIGDDQPENDE